MHGLTSKALRLNWLLAAALSFAIAAHAQPAEEPAEEKTAEAPGSGQVEANEDIYRQFMELKDGLQQRETPPQESWQSRSRMQKLDDLPEDSQKHLRNQLREIILTGDPWQPGDEDKDYPYVPSDAASQDRRLQNQEAGAWDELLDNYHAREAQIHANAERSRAASATAAMPGGMTPNGGEEGDPQAAEAGQQAQREESSATSQVDSFAPAMQSASDVGNEQGVSQSAMDFLNKAGYQAGQPGQIQQQGQQAQTDQRQVQEQESGPGQTSGQTAEAVPGTLTNNTVQADAATAGVNLPSQADTGSEQSAMRYLQQAGDAATNDTGQQGDPAGESESAVEAEATVAPESNRQLPADEDQEPATSGVSQSALEYLSGQAPSETQSDTLSIDDLLNAGGLGAGDGDAEKPKTPDKDG